MIDPATSDGRVIFFLPWQGNTIAGTTDTPTPITQNPLPKEEEIQWILSEVRRYLSPEVKVRRGDVLSAWTGIRPLVRDPAAKNTESLVRNHLINISEGGLMTIAGGKWTTYRQMAEEAVDESIKAYNLKPNPGPRAEIPETGEVEGLVPLVPIDGNCKTEEIELIGAHGYSPTLFISLIQNYGVETNVAKHLTTSYGDRAWEVCELSAPTGQRFPVRGIVLSHLYPFIDGEVRYAVRHEYAQTATDVLARRTRLAFLNVQAALEALPKIVDIMAEELKWDNKRKQKEWENTVVFLESMGLPDVWRGITRKEVENGRVGKFDKKDDYKLYSRHGKSLLGLGLTYTLLTDARRPDGPEEVCLDHPLAIGPSLVDAFCSVLAKSLYKHRCNCCWVVGSLLIEVHLLYRSMIVSKCIVFCLCSSV